MAAIEQYGGGGNGDSLPLYYVHAANGNKGDGAIDNPFGTMELLIAFFDANPDILGATVIVLGGTFTVTDNIYRGNSFYFFPGTKIIFVPTDYTKCLLQDTGSYRYNNNFFFTGDVEIECFGNFIDLGYYFSNALANAGKRWTIDIGKLHVHNVGATPIKLYGSINTYSITFRELTINSPSFITCYKDQRVLSDEVVIANSGCQLELFIDKCLLASAATLLKTGNGAYDFFGRSPKINIKSIQVTNTGSQAILFSGKFNRLRKGVFFVNIDSFFSGILGQTVRLIERVGTNEDGSNPQDIFFIYSGIVFTWNTAFEFGSAGTVRLANEVAEDYLYSVFNNCKIPYGKCLPIVSGVLYSNVTVYNVGAFVELPDRTLYKCLVNGTVGISPVLNTSTAEWEFQSQYSNSVFFKETDPLRFTVGAFVFKTSDSTNTQNCRSINGNILTVFNNENGSLCHSVINN